MGNLTSYNGGAGAAITYTYDGLNHPETMTDGAGNITRFKYDGEGLLIEKTDPKGDSFKTTYEYNSLRSLTKVKDARGAEWVYGYDNDQNLTGITDALNRTTTYEYDTLHRLKKITQPTGLITQYDYDDNSNRNLIIDPLRRKTSITHDSLDRPQQITYSKAIDDDQTITLGDGPRKYTYGYDPEGNLTSVDETLASGNQTVTRRWLKTYDDRGRLETATDVFNKKVQYGYDAANNLTRFTDSANNQTGYVYDAMNRLDKVTLVGGRVVNYGWRADGLIESVDYGQGMTRSYSYDSADRLESVTNQIGPGASEQYIYGYDANSNRESETRKLNGETKREVSFGYDELDRLTSANYAEAKGRGLKGEYFDNRDFTEPKLVRVDQTINFSWPETATPDSRIADDTFSIRWTGKVKAAHTETYTFYTQSDESVRVWVDGRLVVDDSEDHTSREKSGTIDLQAGQKYDIRIEYSEATGDAEIKLSWSSASQTKQIIPQSALFLPDVQMDYS